MKRVLVFSTECPWPPRSGFHRRMLDLLTGLRAHGCEVVFLSTDALTLGAPREAEFAGLRQTGLVQASEVYAVPWANNFLRRAGHRALRGMGISPALDDPLWTLPDMRRWFARRLSDHAPDVVLFFFATWHRLLAGEPGPGGPRRWVDTIDLVTVNRQMWAAVDSRLPKRLPPGAALDPELLAEDFYTRRKLVPDPREFAIYDRFDETIAINAAEAATMAARTRQTRVTHLPMVETCADPGNTYAGPALFTTGPNPFNLQGYYYFTRRVLPTVRGRVPDFELQVTGAVCEQVVDEPGVRRLGFVPDLDELFRDAAFLVCPLLGGTGQLVKVVEAMSRGVPAVVLANAAPRTPIVDGVNGRVARDAAEFAEIVRELWADRAACRRLGEAARETIRENFSPALTREVLGELLGRA